MSKFKGFWNDGFSIDETKTSMLMICFVFCLAFAVVMYYKTGQIGDNFTNVLVSFIYAISGINVASKVAEMFGNKDDFDDNF